MQSKPALQTCSWLQAGGGLVLTHMQHLHLEQAQLTHSAAVALLLPAAVVPGACPAPWTSVTAWVLAAAAAVQRPEPCSYLPACVGQTVSAAHTRSSKQPTQPISAALHRPCVSRLVEAVLHSPAAALLLTL